MNVNLLLLFLLSCYVHQAIKGRRFLLSARMDPNCGAHFFLYYLPLMCAFALRLRTATAVIFYVVFCKRLIQLGTNAITPNGEGKKWESWGWRTTKWWWWKSVVGYCCRFLATQKNNLSVYQSKKLKTGKSVQSIAFQLESALKWAGCEQLSKSAN